MKQGLLILTWFISVAFAVMGQGRGAEVVCGQFLYEQTGFPSCHASTIVQLDNGDLVAAYFGGRYEGSPDVCIWVSRKAVGAAEWSVPILAADGVLSDTLRKACYNPVLQVMPNGELWLFFKIGSCVADWTGWIAKSRDGGLTWGQKMPLPDGFLGPVKDKAAPMGDRLLCPSSTEKDGWRIHFEILDIKTGRWHKVGPVPAAMAVTSMDIGKPDAVLQEIMCIQPALLRLSDGSLKVLCRTKNNRLATSVSCDGGETWSKVTLSDLPNNNSGVDAVTLRDGRHVLVYNPVIAQPGSETGLRTPLVVALSDDGEHWRDVLTLEDDDCGEYSYPAVIEGRNGHLYITYTWHRERIAFREVVLN